MSLETIIAKQPIIDTPTAQNLADNPQEYAERFKFHVTTHVTVADLADKWEKMLRNLEQRKSVTGLIYADTGYGKTSTGAALWNYAEARDFVAVPPFLWASMTDMLVATHGWARFRLGAKRPDLVPALDQQYNTLVQSGLGELSERLSKTQGVTQESARRVVEQLRAEGQVSDIISPNRLLNFLEYTTEQLCTAGYKGLLLLPDEFELFENTSSDIAKNFAQLKEFIFPLFQKNSLPLGCVVITYNKTQAQINQRETYMLARLNKPEGSLINLEAVYGKATDGRPFPEVLWEKLAIQGHLSAAEQAAISPDVLLALGQFLAHPRSTALLSGPRSVVAAFRRAALHFRSAGTPYSIFDFSNDYLSSGMICYNQQEIDAAKAYSAILGQGIVKGNDVRKRIIQLLCVMPGGVPHDIFVKHGIPDADRIEVVQSLIGTYVITTALGPTLAHYRPSEMGGDQMVEVLKIMRDRHNPGSPSTLRAAVRGFVNHLLPTLLKQRVGAAQLGWKTPSILDTDLEPVWTDRVIGTAHEMYPDRTLSIHVGDAAHPTEAGKYTQTNFHLRFILHTGPVTASACQVSEKALAFQFNINHPFDANQVPGAIRKLGDVFLPERVTPLLLLDMLDFFDDQASKVKVGELKLDAQVKMLRSQILNELTGVMFTEQTKAAAVEQWPIFNTIPIGKDFVERALALLIRERYPTYQSVAITHQWINCLERYRQLLTNEESLGIRRGDEPLKTLNSKVPDLFNVSSHVTFRSTYYPGGVLRDLLRVDELDDTGRVVATRIESSNNSRPVGVTFLLHPVEREILLKLQNGPTPFRDRDTKAIQKHQVYTFAEEQGYLSNEVDQLILVLVARGLIVEEDHQGITYLCLQETEISMTELTQAVEELKALDAKARELGFVPEWENAHRPHHLRQRLIDPDTAGDEVAKDHLRRALRDAKKEFAGMATSWLKKAFGDLGGQEKILGTLIIDPAKVLEQTTGHPTTEFSTVLFQNIRAMILDQYKKYNGDVHKAQTRIRDFYGGEHSGYERDKSIANALAVASRLRQQLATGKEEEKGFQQAQDALNTYYKAYQKWRALALQIEQHRTLFAELKADAGVHALLGRLDKEQESIKRHLADRTQTLLQVLEADEHFRARIGEIIAEFNEAAQNRENKFLRYQGDIRDEVIKVVTTAGLNIAYNRNHDEESHREVDRRAVAALHDVCDRAVNTLVKMQVELLKPLEVFQVDPQIRAKAQRLNDDILDMKLSIQKLRNEIVAGNVSSNVAQWVAQLKEISEKATALFTRHNEIMNGLRALREQLSPSAQALLAEIEKGSKLDLTELIISLRGNSSSGFENSAQIIIYLEELYQHNWINIQVNSTVNA